MKSQNKKFSETAARAASTAMGDADKLPCNRVNAQTWVD
jgi:hypothetical protein